MRKSKNKQYNIEELSLKTKCLGGNNLKCHTVFISDINARNLYINYNLYSFDVRMREIVFAPNHEAKKEKSSHTIEEIKL